VGRGDVDFTQDFAATTMLSIDAGIPAVMLAGVHPACFELFARESIRSVADLKGKTVGAAGTTLAWGDYAMLNIIAASVGLDPAKDINWVGFGSGDPKGLLADAKIDAFMTYPPWAQEARALRTGHVILNSATDRPWSQYFCCMLAANRDYAARYPVATKRVIRAVLKAADLCASEPELAARLIVEGGFTERYDYALQTLTENPYGWREYDGEDTIRFYALRLHELGMIKSSPKQIIANGTDWRFLNELKRELKA
jgi:NitT/TauT family transport system substrate-binding protein